MQAALISPDIYAVNENLTINISTLINAGIIFSIFAQNNNG